MINKNKLNVLATICARGGSKGVPGKNIRPLLGKPLLAYTIECAQSTSVINHIIVSTDSDEIAAAAEELGISVCPRPPEMASDKAAKIHAIRHATDYVEKNEEFYPDIVTDLDVTVPLRAPQDVEACVRYFFDHDVEAVVTAYEAERNPYFNMVEFDGSRVHLVKQAPSPVVCRQDAPPVYGVSGSVFAFRRDRLMSVTHLYSGRWGACIVPRERAVDVDHEMDFKFVEFLMRQQTNDS